MLPEAAGEDLLYVTAYSNVLVFSYPAGKLVGTLKGFYSAAGECVDSSGNVFISNWRPRGVYEYAHGGTKRIAFLKTTKVGPLACSISPTTGDLAICGASSYVEFYRGAKGNAVLMQDARMQFGDLDTYDSKGNLFFLGIKVGKHQNQQLSELRAGATHFANIRVETKLYSEGGLQWNNGLLTAVSDTKSVYIYQLQIKGTRALKVGATPLSAPAYIVLQYFIDGSTVIVPNRLTSGSDVLYYNYPTGGSPTFTLPASSGARAVVVSHAT